MIDLDTSRLPSDLATTLLLRGSQLPPLEWHVNPFRDAKSVLDTLADDKKLLGGCPLADEPMASAVRSLLYFWNGWPAECGMYAQAAPKKERLYVAALCERQAGNPADAKTRVQELNGHPIYGALAKYGLSAICTRVAAPLKRLRGMIELADEWEPYAFIDVYEQARLDKLDHAGEQIVRSIQCREFELLFVHCFEAATGGKLPAPERNAPPRRRPRQRPQTRRSIKPVGSGDSPRHDGHGAAPPITRKPVRDSIGISCPKCGDVKILPPTARGTKTTCNKCRVVFLIPTKPVTARK